MTPLRVLDVSRWQGRIDWDAVQRSGAIDGVMLRVLGSRNGQPYPDPQFERNHAACTARGIPVGGYYYTCAVTSRQTEAELNALRAALRLWAIFFSPELTNPRIGPILAGIFLNQRRPKL